VAPRIICEAKILRGSSEIMIAGPRYKKLTQKRKMLEKMKLLRMDLNLHKSKGVLFFCALTSDAATFSIYYKVTI
jgi:hypothetical protein